MIFDCPLKGLLHLLGARATHLGVDEPWWGSLLTDSDRAYNEQTGKSGKGGSCDVLVEGVASLAGLWRFGEDGVEGCYQGCCQHCDDDTIHLWAALSLLG